MLQEIGPTAGTGQAFAASLLHDRRGGRNAPYLPPADHRHDSLKVPWLYRPSIDGSGRWSRDLWYCRSGADSQDEREPHGQNSPRNREQSLRSFVNALRCANLAHRDWRDPLGQKDSLRHTGGGSNRLKRECHIGRRTYYSSQRVVPGSRRNSPAKANTCVSGGHSASSFISRFTVIMAAASAVCVDML